MNASDSSCYASDTLDPASDLVNQNLRTSSIGIPLNVDLIILANQLPSNGIASRAREVGAACGTVNNGSPARLGGFHQAKMLVAKVARGPGGAALRRRLLTGEDLEALGARENRVSVKLEDELAGVALGPGRDVKGREGSDVGGLAGLVDLAVVDTVVDCAGPDFVEGGGGRIDGGVGGARLRRRRTGVVIRGRSSKGAGGEAEDGGDCRGGKLHFDCGEVIDRIFMMIIEEK